MKISNLSAMKVVIGLFLTMLIFSGCSKTYKSSDVNSNEELKLGIFVDAKVDGLFYKTPTQSGFTHEGGDFFYLEGETVSFYLGENEHGLKIGSAFAKFVVQPDDLAAGDENKTALIVQLLLSTTTLENDLMTVTPQTQKLFSNSKFTDKDYLTIVQELNAISTDLGEFIVNNNISSKIYTKAEANAHIEETLNAIRPKIGVLLDLESYAFGDVNTTLLPLISEEIHEYLKVNKVLFRDVEFILRDTKNDTALALKELTAMKNLGVRIVVGPYSSSVAQAILPFANENDMLLISPSSTASSLEISDNLFRMATSDTEQVNALVELIKSSPNIKNIIPLYRDDIYGEDYYRDLQKHFANDSNVVVHQGIVVDSNTLNTLEAQIKSADLNDTVVVVLIDLEEQAINLLNDLNVSSLAAQVKWFASEDMINIDINGSLKETLNKIELSGVAVTTSDSEVFVYYENVLSKLKKSGAKNIDPFTLNAWDSLWLATEVFKENVEVVLHGQDANDSEVTTQLHRAIEITAAKTFGTTGFITLNEFGDRDSANFTYYSYANSEWVPRGYYKQKPYEANQLLIRDINVSSQLMDINKSITIGAIINDETWSKDADSLAKLAIERVNDFYKDTHYNVSLVIADNNTKPYTQTAMLEDLKKLHDDGVEIVVTLVESDFMEQMQDYAAENNMVILDCVSTAVQIAKNDTTFRLTPNDSLEVEALVFQLHKVGIENVIIVHSDNVYADDYTLTFESIYNGNIVNRFLYTVGEVIDTSSFATELVKMDKTNSAVLFIGSDISATGISNLDSSTKGLIASYPWYGTDSISFSDEVKNSGLDLTFITYDHKGFGYFMPQFNDLNLDINNSFLTTDAINAYDAIWLASIREYEVLGSSYSLSHSFKYSPEKIHGISGLLGFDLNGDRATASYGFYKVVNNDWKLVSIYNNTAHGVSHLSE